MGTPRREVSLKQLIDRIVKTYRKSGEDYKYFASPADAEIFERELAYALLHQVDPRVDRVRPRRLAGSVEP
ncbi:hypothetical protein N7U49_46855 [Streptomyces sp. AD2-2]|nr:hypothetical protein N7U49_46855 [Streptomyces sp. AD2-2]